MAFKFLMQIFSTQVIIPDVYNNNKHSSFIGTFVLNKRRILIERNAHLCTYCFSGTCLHYQAFELCSNYNSLQVCEANNLENIIYYLPNAKDIFLLADDTFHNFQLNNGSWLCSSCPSKCKHHFRLHNILDQVGSDTPIKNQNKV